MPTICQALVIVIYIYYSHIIDLMITTLLQNKNFNSHFIDQKN